MLHECQNGLEVYTQLFKLSRDAVIIWEPGKGIVFWNQGAKKLYGYSEDEATNFRGKGFLKPEFPVSEEQVHDVLSKEGVWNGDIREVTKSGENVIVAAQLQTIAIGDCRHILAINRDVTQERDQDQRISLQARLLQLCPDAIIETHKEEGISFWNDGAERLYGYSHCEVQGKNLQTLLQSEYSQPFEQIVAVLERDGEWQGDVFEKNKAGDKLTVSSIIQYYSHDGLDFYLRANRDVTAHRLLQNDLIKINKALVISNRELDEFAYIATHDLKEPFRGIAINADILLREELSEKAVARVRRMSLLCQRIDQLLSDLLYFSRLANAENLETRIDINEIIKEISLEVQSDPQYKLANIAVKTELPAVCADPIKIKKVFGSLISNGLIFNDTDKPVVHIGFLPVVNQDDLQLRNMFYVRDNGIGIETKNQAKVFQFFKRLNRDEDYGFGSGAGLSIVKKLVERYGGEISLISEPDKGSTFYFSLPLDLASDDSGDDSHDGSHDGSGDGSGDDSGDSSGDSSGNGLGDGSGDDSGDGSGSGTDNQLI